ncbi:hypothetical protein SARC_14782 [Sphaeroforma arctica JP610]|uniref:PI3K/PI4K catalytic domain-containing protein n=1 Tax=Sphaeroforma arctica JP610 TaxID=667725 RepID=A0A0L0F7E8_9EUKA|nr:hypothetical protein SARC_14782 [Sphaeroforma arctica JP610]KNC72657.1 hypothetical protein SARC_14782 [Sphaeroforma arctica JP610]|eukprot:XP_014146559.1 hypothetical protein SARC_14782 [Sphaeroforma arctica JP610]
MNSDPSGAKSRSLAKTLHDMVGLNGSKLCDLRDSSEFKKVYSTMQAVANSKPAQLLKEYSPWLAAFHSADHRAVDAIEIPGRYSGTAKPIPSLHPTITKFDETVLVLSSIRRPKRIKMLANDGSVHPFLVKGGEDLRLDQRVEGIFDSMNSVFGQNTECRRRRLRLTTYAVVPVSK